MQRKTKNWLITFAFIAGVVYLSIRFKDQIVSYWDQYVGKYFNKTA